MPHGRKHVQFTNTSPKIWGSFLKNWGGKKHAKFGPILDPFPFWARISSERTEISKIGKLFYQQHFLPGWATKSGELCYTNHGDLEAQIYPQNQLFQKDHISAPKGCSAPKVLHARQNGQVVLAHTPERMLIAFVPEAYPKTSNSDFSFFFITR